MSSAVRRSRQSSRSIDRSGSPLGLAGEQDHGESQAVQVEQERVEIGIVLIALAGHGQEGAPRRLGIQRPGMDRLPPARAEGTLLAAQGHDQGQPGNPGELGEELLDGRRVTFPGRLEIVQSEDRGIVLEIEEDLRLERRDRLGTHHAGDRPHQAVPAGGTIAADEPAALAETIRHPPVVESREGNGRLARSGGTQHGDRRGQIAAERLGQMADFGLPPEAARPGRQPRMRAPARRGRAAVRGPRLPDRRPGRRAVERRVRCTHQAQQVVAQLRRPAVPQERLLGQAQADDLVEAVRQPRHEAAGRRGRVVQDRGHDRELPLAAERPLPGRHLVEDDSEREEVAPVIHPALLDLLRRHVGRGPDDAPGPGQTGVLRPLPERSLLVERSLLARSQLGDPEIEDFDAPVAGHHDVARLQIAVDDAPRMRRLQRLGQGERQGKQAIEGDRTAGGEQVGHRLPLDHLQDEEMQALGFLHRVDGDDVRMVERGDRPGLALEALQVARIQGPVRREDLESHPALETLVLGEEDLAHSSASKPPDHPVVGEGAMGQLCCDLPAGHGRFSRSRE